MHVSNIGMHVTFVNAYYAKMSPTVMETRSLDQNCHENEVKSIDKKNYHIKSSGNSLGCDTLEDQGRHFYCAKFEGEYGQFFQSKIEPAIP